MKDWGEVSELYEEIQKMAFNRVLANESEAQTRFDVIDRILREVLQWQHGQISVEPYVHGNDSGFIDYLLISGDIKIIIEAKKIGSTFPTPTKAKKLKLTGSVLGKGEINSALEQAGKYAESIDASFVGVTNGEVWCFYPRRQGESKDSIYATLIFPFDIDGDAEMLFNVLACYNVEKGSLSNISSDKPITNDSRLINHLRRSDTRGRNNIADAIMPALDNAILSEALLENPEVLDKCYVSTDNRVKYDKTLDMYLSQYKPEVLQPAKRLKRSKDADPIEEYIIQASPSIAPPVTLVIGSVGSGKSNLKRAKCSLDLSRHGGAREGG